MHIKELTVQGYTLYGIATNPKGLNMYKDLWFTTIAEAKRGLIAFATSTYKDLEEKYANRVNSLGKSTQGRWAKEDRQLWELAKNVAETTSQEIKREEEISNFLSTYNLTLEQVQQNK